MWLFLEKINVLIIAIIGEILQQPTQLNKQQGR